MQGNVPQESLSRGNQIHQLTRGYGQTAVDLTAEGWLPYLLVLKFRHLGGRRDSRIAQMHHAAEGAYAQLLTRVWKHPRAASVRALRPYWLLIADTPVAKRTKVHLRDLLPNDGLHLQGVAVMPPGSRMRKGLDEHLAREGARYCPQGGPLVSLHATPIVSDLPYVHRYNFKMLERGRGGVDDILQLPVSSAELDSRPRPAADPWRAPIFERN